MKTEISERLLQIQNALKNKTPPPEFELLLDSLLSFCLTKQPDVLDIKRKHVSFKRLNCAISKANGVILPLFQG